MGEGPIWSNNKNYDLQSVYFTKQFLIRYCYLEEAQNCLEKYNFIVIQQYQEHTRNKKELSSFFFNKLPVQSILRPCLTVGYQFCNLPSRYVHVNVTFYINAV